MFIGCGGNGDDNNEIIYAVKNIKSDTTSTMEVQQGNRVMIEIAESANKVEKMESLNGTIEKTDNSLKYYYDAPYIGNSDILTVTYTDSSNNVKTTNYNVTLKNKVTFMLYLSAENTLGRDKFNIYDLKEIAAVNMEKNNKNVNIVVYLDTIGVYENDTENLEKTGNGCYVYTGNKSDTICVNNNIITGFKNTGYYGTGNTGDVSELTNFIDYAKDNFQSEKYLLDLWSHGDGWRKDHYLNKKSRYIIVDDGDKSSFNMWELEIAIKKSKIPKIDIVYMDACLMGGIEVAYQLKDVSDYLVFSPEPTPGLGGDYTNIIKGINESDFSNQSISKKIVYANGEYYKNFWESYGNYPCVFSAVNQSKLTDLINAMKSVSEEIVKIENSEVIGKIKEFRKEPGLGVKNTSDVLCYDYDYYDYTNVNSIYVDLGDLFVNIQKILTTANHTTALEADIKILLTALNNYVTDKTYVNGKCINNKVTTEKIESDTSGLSIYLDLENMSGANEYAEYKTATSFGALTWYQKFLNKLYGL